MKLLATVAALLAPAALVAAVAYDDQPPPAHTGGFDEPTCASCHFDGPVDDGGGELKLMGLPERYEPGAEYVIRVVLSRPELAKAGFQLAARTGAAAQAGSLESSDHRTAVTEAGGVSYIHHTFEGTRPDAEGANSWTIRWTAPEEGGDVFFHIAANAANADFSAFGDHIYTHEKRVSDQ